jgi:hypothetical protein
MAASASLTAQNVILTGALSGRATDQSGAVAGQVLVAVRNVETGAEQTTRTNSSGLFRFPALAPGAYSLTASLNGFRDAQGLVQVRVGNVTLQDIRLQLGVGKERVDVTGAAPLLHPAEVSIDSVLEQPLIEELPLNGRRYTDLTLLTPNTNTDGDTGLISMAGQQGGEDSGYANGNGSNAFTVDGTNATSNYFGDILGRYRIPYLYGENAISEFQVAIGPYSAVYGGGAGFINSVTRSGTNALHGSGFYYNRNSVFEANDSLSNASGYPKQEDSLQQFGASLGGAIVRNRSWFFVDYEQQRQNDPISVINPALTQLQSNLSTYFGIPNGTALPAPNAPYPMPGNGSVPDPTNPAYLQQVSNAINLINSNLGTHPRKKNDLVVTSRLDYQATSRDTMFLSFNANYFDSPGGIITVSPVAVYGKQTLANAEVHDFQVSLGWTHAFSSKMLNEFHTGASDDNQIANPTGLAANMPTVILDSPASFTLGNAPFSIGRVFERQWSVADRVDYMVGKHTLQFGFDMNRAFDADTNFGGADPNADVQFGSFLGSYEFSNLESFALGEYNLFSQASGNPVFSFHVPYYGFYAQDSFRPLHNLTLEIGLREDFQVYPQPMKNPAFPLTGQYPNQFSRLAPRFGLAWQPTSKTVVRSGFGQFYDNMNGLNYRNAVVSNGLASQQSSVSVSYTPDLLPNQQLPTFANILPSNSPLFQASPDISLVSPQFRVPYVLQASLQVTRELSENTSVTAGFLGSHAVHLISGSAYDMNLNPVQGATTYIVCPAGTSSAPCNGRTFVLPNMDNGLLTEGALDPNLDQINELISPGRSYYRSFFALLQHRMSRGLFLQLSYTLGKSTMKDGMDFNNQFDFRNANGPSLLDQRHRISLAAVYLPRLERFTNSHVGHAILSGWRFSSVMEFSSGRPYASLLSPACTSANLSFSNCGLIVNSTLTGNDNLNDTAFNQDTSNTAAGINGAGPTPGTELNSFYGPWLERVDVALARNFSVAEGKQLQLQLQVFNLFNHANFYVQNGDGVNQLQYNPVGTNCGDGVSLNQTCYLVPNSGPGNFGSLQEISPNGLPRAIQFSARFSF